MSVMVSLMPRPATFFLYDRLMGGTLEQFLRDRREAGDSFETISYLLRDQGHHISGRTLARWYADLDDKAAS